MGLVLFMEKDMTIWLGPLNVTNLMSKKVESFILTFDLVVVIFVWNPDPQALLFEPNSAVKRTTCKQVP